MSMGANMRPKSLSTLILLPILAVLLSLKPCISVVSTRDTQALLKFKKGLMDPSALSSWNPPTPPCTGSYPNWGGVICFEGNIWGLQLENMGLNGDIDLDTLVLLPHLRTLSFMNNKFDGPMPNFKKLGALKALYLSNNEFSGEIPDEAFAGMGSLKRVFMSNNKFSGRIPSSLGRLPRLLELKIDGNKFSGEIPDFKQKGLKLVNMANNNLEGPIPQNLVGLPSSSFSGNKNICGKPTGSKCSPKKDDSSSEDPSLDNNKSSFLKTVVIILAIAIVLLAIILIIVLCIRRSKESHHGQGVSPYGNKSVAALSGHKSYPEESGSTSGTGGSTKKGELGKLSFVRNDGLRFDLQDLLRASAEVLGSGSFGSSYKAVLMNGQSVVVKRFKQMNNVGREEFQEHMRRLGRLTHPNLLPLVAYYYRKEEKLLVFNYVENRSLASHLHGNHTLEQPGLDWPTRLKIVKGVAKGLSYLQNELPSLMAPHGHLKSSNVLLDDSFEPLLMDYTLVPVINQEHANQIMVAYKSPEYAQYGRVTKKSDVWCLGILILEILTGKFPATYLANGNGNGNGVDLGIWVKSIAEEEETSTVFDKEMGSTRNSEVEMKKLLRIGVGCCEEDVDKRWDLKEVTEKILELKERDNGSDIVIGQDYIVSCDEVMCRV